MFLRPVQFWLRAKSSLLLGQDETLSVTNVTQRWWRDQAPKWNKRWGNKKEEAENKSQKCGETERDTGCSMEASVAWLPRMLSDSGWVMTGSRGHSESERAGATLETGAPLSLGQSAQAAQPAPPAATGGAASHLIYSSVRSECSLFLA